MASAATATRQAGPGPSSPAADPSASMAQPIPEPWDGLDTRILTDLARRGLMSTLDTIKEAKTLMLDPSLAGPLGLVADVSSLKHTESKRCSGLSPHLLPLSPGTMRVILRRRQKQVSKCQCSHQIGRLHLPSRDQVDESHCRYVLPSLHIPFPSPPFPVWTKLAEPTRSLQR